LGYEKSKKRHQPSTEGAVPPKSPSSSAEDAHSADHDVDSEKAPYAIWLDTPLDVAPNQNEQAEPFANIMTSTNTEPCKSPLDVRALQRLGWLTTPGWTEMVKTPVGSYVVRPATNGRRWLHAIRVIPPLPLFTWYGVLIFPLGATVHIFAAIATAISVQGAVPFIDKDTVEIGPRSDHRLEAVSNTIKWVTFASLNLGIVLFRARYHLHMLSAVNGQRCFPWPLRVSAKSEIGLMWGVFGGGLIYFFNQGGSRISASYLLNWNERESDSRPDLLATYVCLAATAFFSAVFALYECILCFGNALAAALRYRDIRYAFELGCRRLEGQLQIE
jgi:hypothetical protein